MRLSCSLSRMRGNLLDTLLNSPDLQTIIGLREWIALPELGVVGLRAKIDTGASTSALHATDISEFKRNGERWVRFTAHLGTLVQSRHRCEARGRRR